MDRYLESGLSEVHGGWNITHTARFYFLKIPSLLRKSSSISGIPSRSLIFGSQPNNSFAFVMSGFLWRGSSGVFSTVMIFTSGLIIYNTIALVLRLQIKLYVPYRSYNVKCFWRFSNVTPQLLLGHDIKLLVFHQGCFKYNQNMHKYRFTSFTVSASSSIVNSPDSKVVECQ